MATDTPTDGVTLTEALAFVERYFPRDRVLADYDRELTIRYYTESEPGYRKYHSLQDCVHFALNEDGRFDPEGYYAQPQYVSAQVQAVQAAQVLEVGCGKGFNSLFLAQQHPTVQFTGVDLTPRHVQIAARKAAQIPNLVFRRGDFNQLDVADQSVDLVFGVDCLCHAADSRRVLTELYRVLRSGGRLVVFDGYRRAELAAFEPEMQLAMQLTEVAMAVRHGFPVLADWLAVAESVGFTLMEQQDQTQAILPNLYAVQALAKRYFRRPWRAKLLQWVLPKYLVRNAIAGLLLPLVCDAETGAFSYQQLVLAVP
ncbi:class I SAM-dependent methyltransferase [Trichothermofontia sichuanensis B231]|uniref:class I SAM-dependent methyltransferase n=1 Tax=Trichothermofontia sichuanensis TaxID=3045816 RepID=UPI002245ED7B|nr:class I SAM-dependent methyltransferase [Trichothermofontia sichuanensis]UZQ55044.1 class I SAM-dependent methyltransferase [Trichothermofontia sichuanensis B231]